MTSEPGFKQCPYCLESIRAEAIKCRYCGEWFEQHADPFTGSVAVSGSPASPDLELPAVSTVPAPSPAAQNVPKRSWERLVALSCCFLLSAGILAIGIAKLPFNATNIEQLTRLITSTVLKVVFPVALISFFIRKSHTAFTAALWLIAATALSAFFYSAGQSAKRNELHANRTFAADLDSVTKKADAYLKSDGKAPVPAFDTTDPANRAMAQKLNEAVAIIAPAGAALTKRINALRLQSVFDTSVLTNSASVSEEIRKRHDILKAVRETRSNLLVRLASIPAPTPDPVHPDAYRPNLGVELGNRLREEYGFIEKQYQAELEFLQFMLQRSGTYSFSGGKISFKDPSVIPVYNTLADNVTRSTQNLQSRADLQEAERKAAVEKLRH